jgi:hypothetical protein
LPAFLKLKDNLQNNMPDDIMEEDGNFDPTAELKRQ